MPGKPTVAGKVALLIVGRQDLIKGSKEKRGEDVVYKDLRFLGREVFTISDRVEFHDHCGIKVLKDRFMGRHG